MPSESHRKCQELSIIVGRIYSKTVSFVKKIYQRKGFWVSESAAKKRVLCWGENIDAHTHSKRASVEQYFEALRSFFSSKKHIKGARLSFRTKRCQTLVRKNIAVKLLEGRCVANFLRCSKKRQNLSVSNSHTLTKSTHPKSVQFVGFKTLSKTEDAIANLEDSRVARKKGG